MNNIKLSFISFLILIILSCGGGSSSDSNIAPPINLNNLSIITPYLAPTGNAIYTSNVVINNNGSTTLSGLHYRALGISAADISLTGNQCNTIVGNSSCFLALTVAANSIGGSANIEIYDDNNSNTTFNQTFTLRDKILTSGSSNSSTLFGVQRFNKNNNILVYPKYLLNTQHQFIFSVLNLESNITIINFTNSTNVQAIPMSGASIAQNYLIQVDNTSQNYTNQICFNTNSCQSFTINYVHNQGILNIYPQNISFTANDSSYSRIITLYNSGTVNINNIAASDLNQLIAAGYQLNSDGCKISTQNPLKPNTSCQIILNTTQDAVTADTATTITLLITAIDSNGVSNTQQSLVQPAGGLQISTLTPFATNVNNVISQNLTITNLGIATKSNFNLSNLPQDFNVNQNNCNLDLEPNSSCNMTIQYQPSIVNSGISFALLGYNIGDNNYTTNVAINYVATNPQANLQLTPIDYNFNNVAVGESASTDFVLTNIGTATATTLNFNFSAPLGFSQTNNCNNSLSINSSCIITIKFNPLNAIDYSSNLTVSTSNSSTMTALLGMGISSANISLTKVNLSGGESNDQEYWYQTNSTINFTLTFVNNSKVAITNFIPTLLINSQTYTGSGCANLAIDASCIATFNFTANNLPTIMQIILSSDTLKTMENNIAIPWTNGGVDNQYTLNIFAPAKVIVTVVSTDQCFNCVYQNDGFNLLFNLVGGYNVANSVYGVNNIPAGITLNSTCNLSSNISSCVLSGTTNFNTKVGNNNINLSGINLESNILALNVANAWQYVNNISLAQPTINNFINPVFIPNTTPMVDDLVLAESNGVNYLSFYTALSLQQKNYFYLFNSYYQSTNLINLLTEFASGGSSNNITLESNPVYSNTLLNTSNGNIYNFYYYNCLVVNNCNGSIADAGQNGINLTLNHNDHYLVTKSDGTAITGSISTPVKLNDEQFKFAVLNNGYIYIYACPFTSTNKFSVQCTLNNTSKPLISLSVTNSTISYITSPTYDVVAYMNASNGVNIHDWINGAEGDSASVGHQTNLKYSSIYPVTTVLSTPKNIITQDNNNNVMVYNSTGTISVSIGQADNNTHYVAKAKADGTLYLGLIQNGSWNLYSITPTLIKSVKGSFANSINTTNFAYLHQGADIYIDNNNVPAIAFINYSNLSNNGIAVVKYMSQN